MSTVDSIINNLGTSVSGTNNNDNKSSNIDMLNSVAGNFVVTDNEGGNSNHLQDENQQRKHLAFFPNNNNTTGTNPSAVPFQYGGGGKQIGDNIHGHPHHNMNTMFSQLEDSNELPVTAGGGMLGSAGTSATQMPTDIHQNNNNNGTNGTTMTNMNHTGDSVNNTGGSIMDSPRGLPRESSDAALDVTTGGIAGGGDAPHPISNLYVTNLSMGVDNDLLFSWFRPFGPLISACVMVDVQTGRSRGYGFVQYENEPDGENALKNLNGRVMPVPHDNQTIILRVQRSVHKKVSQPAPSTCVFVRNIPNHYNSGNLLPLMKQYGEVERIQLYSITDSPNLLKACVEFKKREGALAAVNALHRKLLDPTCEVALAARFADNRKPQGSSSNNNTNSSINTHPDSPTTSLNQQQQMMNTTNSSNPFERAMTQQQQQQQGMNNNNMPPPPPPPPAHHASGFNGMPTSAPPPLPQQQQQQHQAIEVGASSGISKERLAQCQIVKIDGKFYRLVPIDNEQEVMQAQMMADRQQQQQQFMQQQQYNTSSLGGSNTNSPQQQGNFGGMMQVPAPPQMMQSNNNQQQNHQHYQQQQFFQQQQPQQQQRHFFGGNF